MKKNPEHRPTAEEALDHPAFDKIRASDEEILTEAEPQKLYPGYMSSPQEGMHLVKPKFKDRLWPQDSDRSSPICGSQRLLKTGDTAKDEEDAKARSPRSGNISVEIRNESKIHGLKEIKQGKQGNLFKKLLRKVSNSVNDSEVREIKVNIPETREEPQVSPTEGALITEEGEMYVAVRKLFLL